MRAYTEPTCRNFLKRPLIMGVELEGLLILLGTSGLFIALMPSGRVRDITSLTLLSVGYLSLRISKRFLKLGSIESLLFKIESLVVRMKKHPKFLGKLTVNESIISITHPDTLELDDEQQLKQKLTTYLEELDPLNPRIFVFAQTKMGMDCNEVKYTTPNGVHDKLSVWEASDGFIEKNEEVYSLTRLPASTTPTWINCELQKITGNFMAFFRVQPIDSTRAEKLVKHSRKRSSLESDNGELDSEVTFEDAGLILEGILRGTEKLIELSMTIVCEEPQTKVNPEYFTREKEPLLNLASILGARKRPHRAHLVRAVTASDLMPTLVDKYIERISPLLKSIRENDLYFDPLSKDLRALHWLVCGSSGSGKSFFTGVILSRLLERHRPISILFIDHGKSFKKFTTQFSGNYVEPRNLAEIMSVLPAITGCLNRPGKVFGVELATLTIAEKSAACDALLRGIETYLKSRETHHKVFIIIDECWNFMRENAQLVETAFREYRKLNGAVIAISQSLKDFLKDTAGQSLIQNGSVRVLLHQNEDMRKYEGDLNLNEREMILLKNLDQENGSFSEALIKFGRTSLLARLYPTPKEFELFRTDNFGAEDGTGTQDQGRVKESGDGTPSVDNPVSVAVSVAAVSAVGRDRTSQDSMVKPINTCGMDFELSRVVADV